MTTQEAITRVLAQSRHPLAPADIHARLEQRGVDTSVEYVYQVLTRLKKEGEAEQPRPGRWQLSEPTGSNGPAIHAEPGEALPFHAPGHAPPSTGKPTPSTFFVLRGPDGRVVLYLEAVLHVGEPIGMTGEVHPMGAAG